MKTSPLRLRLPPIAGVVLIFAAAVALAEFLYRATFRRELASLERSLDSLHNFRPRTVEIGRFGFYGPAVEPSLREDLLEWAKLRLGRPSKLDGGDIPVPWLNGYYAVHFTMQHTDNSWPPDFCHVFIWSPRRLQFVHYMNSGNCPGSPAGPCPWRQDPAPGPGRAAAF